MHSASDFLTLAVHRLLRLALGVFVGLVVAGFLLLGISVALLSVLWSLLRGKKPAMFTVFQTFQQASRQFRRGASPGAPRSAAADVVDVQAHEVRPALPSHTEA